MPMLENVEMKFDRAMKHAAELRDACQAFLATEPYSYTRTVEGGSSPESGSVHVLLEDLPDAAARAWSHRR
jgi:hypothetical protein